MAKKTQKKSKPIATKRKSVKPDIPNEIDFPSKLEIKKRQEQSNILSNVLKQNAEIDRNKTNIGDIVKQAKVNLENPTPDNTSETVKNVIDESGKQKNLKEPSYKPEEIKKSPDADINLKNQPEFEYQGANKIINEESIPSKVNTNPLEDLMERWNKFRNIKPIASKVTKIIPPIAGGLEYADSSKNFQSALGSNDLNAFQKWGKGLKGTGAAINAGALASEIGTLGAASPLAIPAAVAGTGLYGIGEGLEYYGSPSKVNEREQELEKNKQTITQFADALQSNAPNLLKGGYLPKDYERPAYNRDVFRKTKLSDLNEEQLLNIAGSGYGSNEVKNAVINDVIKNSGEKAWDHLAFINVENAPFDKFAKNENSSAEGLYQITNDAYKDVQKNNPIFKDIPKWKMLQDTGLQSQVHESYKDVIKNYIRNSLNQEPTEDLVTRMYNQGFKTNKEYKDAADAGMDIRGNPLTDDSESGGKSIQQKKDIMYRRGYDGADAYDYLEKIEGAKKIVPEQIKQNQLYESSSKDLAGISGDPEKLKALENTLLFLKNKDPEVSKLALNKLFPEALVLKTTPEEEQTRQRDIDRLMDLKKRFEDRYTVTPPTSSLSDVENLAKETEEPQESEETTEPPSDLSGDISRLIASEKGYTESSRENLKNVQDQANNLRMMNLLVEGASQLGRGIAGAKSGYIVKPGEPFTALSEQADALEKQFKEKVALQSDDPESQASASARNIAKTILTKMKVDPSIVDGMSANSIFKILPQIKDLYETDIKATYVKDQKEKDRTIRQDLKDQAAFKNLGFQLENIGGLAGNRLRNRILQSGNIYGTLGIYPKDLQQMSNKQIENTLDDAKKLSIVESAIELNALLAQSGNPSQKTLEKLLFDSGWQRGMGAAEFLTNRQFGRDQGKYLRQILDMTARIEQTALKDLQDMKIRALSGTTRFANNPTIAEDYLNLISKHNISLDDLRRDSDKKTKDKITPVSGAEDSDIRDLANRKFNGNYDITKQWLISTGQLK